MAGERTVGDVSYAGFWARLAAYIVDFAIVITLSLAVAIGAAFAGEIGMLIGFIINLLINFLYWPVLESSARQATIGKSIVGIQVTDLSGNRMTFLRAFLRNLAKIISSIPLGIGFLMAAFTARKQALHDIVTDSLVVSTGPSRVFKALAAALIGLIISVGAGVAYFKYIYLTQAQDEFKFSAEMQSAIKTMAQSAPPYPENLPAPAKQAVPSLAAAPTPNAVPPIQASGVISSVPEISRMESAAVTQVSAVIAAAASQPVAPETAAVAESAPVPEPAPVMDSLSGAESTSREALPRSPKALSDVSSDVIYSPDSESPNSNFRVIKPKYNDVMTAVLRSDDEAVKQLLDLGWWVDKPGADGYTPLTAAVMNRDTQMVQLLLDHGAIPSPQLLKLAQERKDTATLSLLEQRGVR